MEWIAQLSEHVCSLDEFREEVRATFDPFVGKLNALDEVMRILRHATSDLSRRVDEIDAKVGASARRLRFEGVALPGLADAHVHVMMFGEQLGSLDLRGLDKQTIVRLVAERAAAAPPGGWIDGRGWDQGSWTPAAFPTAADLDGEIPDHPVVLDRIDAHSVWVNSAALRAAGITRDTPDPAGGRIMRLPSGSPSGVP